MMLERPMVASAQPPPCALNPRSIRYDGKCSVMNASWKPQVKKPNTSRTYERRGHASLSALVSDCAGGVLDPAFPEAFGGVARASANGTMSSSMLPKVSSAYCQPKLSIS